MLLLRTHLDMGIDTVQYLYFKVSYRPKKDIPSAASNAA